LTRVRYIFM